jgi:hypothetical protein
MHLSSYFRWKTDFEDNSNMVCKLRIDLMRNRYITTKQCGYPARKKIDNKPIDRWHNQVSRVECEQYLSGRKEKSSSNSSVASRTLELD